MDCYGASSEFRVNLTWEKACNVSILTHAEHDGIKGALPYL